MKNTFRDITKASGEVVEFLPDKLQRSLKRTGADQQTIKEIINLVKAELYPGITTKEIYNRAFNLLKKKKSYFASKYKLKKAIYELGPTGFPFEKFVSAILNYSGYTTNVNKILKGKCISHEIDVIAQKGNETTIIECKFHSEQGLNCNVKIPLYINSRYRDVKQEWIADSKNGTLLSKGWLVTNTRFTSDALKYGICSNLYLISWDYPKNNGLKDRIDRLGLYPITVSTLLSSKEKQFLLGRGLVLCRELLQNKYYLDHLGISEIRKEKILKEITQLCSINACLK